MAAVKGRRRRLNDQILTVPMQSRVAISTREKARAVADSLGVSMSQYLDELVANDQLDDDGRPVWWREPVEDERQDAFLDKDGTPAAWATQNEGLPMTG